MFQSVSKTRIINRVVNEVFVFKRDEEIVVIVFLVLKFSLLLTRFPNFCAIYTLKWDPRANMKPVL